MAGANAQPALVMKQDLMRPKLDSSDLLKRIEELERQVAELKRRG